MKYSQNLTWAAIGLIQPKVLEAKESGVSLNIVAMLKSAAVECFLHSEEVEFKTSFPKTVAAHVIRTALLELDTVGFIVFGKEDKLW
jgi:hypothetical protein